MLSEIDTGKMIGRAGKQINSMDLVSKKHIQTFKYPCTVDIVSFLIGDLDKYKSEAHIQYLYSNVDTDATKL